MKLKAYVVRDPERYLEVSLLVYAVNASRALTLAAKDECVAMGDTRRKDLKATREPRADYAARQAGAEGVNKCATIDDCRILRDLGWYEFDNHTDCCEECELYPWERVPESLLSESLISGLWTCKECQKRELDTQPKL